MVGVVVRTVEELKAAQKRREHPTIIIEGELAGNLIASGILSRDNDNGAGQAVTPRLHAEAKSSPIYSVVELIRDITRLNYVEVAEGVGGRRIKITPVSSGRRDK